MSERWKLETNGESVNVVGIFSSEDEVDKLITALEAQKPILNAAEAARLNREQNGVTENSEKTGSENG